MKWTWRVLHGAAVLGALSGLCLIGIIALFALAMAMPDKNREWMEWGLPVLFSVTLVLAVFASWRSVSFKFLVPTMVGCGVVLGWLAIDGREPELLPPNRPAASKESKSYQVLMWMSRDSRYSRIEERKLGLPEGQPLRLPSDTKDRLTFVSDHRAEIATRWNEDAIGQDWVAALNQFPPDGVFLYVNGESMLSFQDIRSVFEYRFMQGMVLLADGKSAESVSLLVESLGAIRQLQRGSGTLVNQMIAQVLLNRCGLVAGVMLDASELSVTWKARLAKAFDEALPVAQAIEQAFEGEQRLVRETYRIKTKDVPSLLFGFGDIAEGTAGTWCIGPLLYNANGSFSAYSQFLERVRVLGAERKLEELKILIQEAGGRGAGAAFSLKNPLGSQFAAMAGGAFDKLTAIFWENEDRRLALIARLEGR